ncbi:MAG: MBL fold metallo-hydrolase [Myxococcales bacterium]|nr:MBL fold metallo-hydrolase [Myxococcales bacterium]
MGVLATLLACGAPDAPVNAPRQVTEPRADLFAREVSEVVDGIHVAIGYGLANSILIEGDGGVIVVDTMESGAAATEVLAAFRAITDDPVVAVVLTHNHADHVFGSAVFAADPSVPIYAHASTAEQIHRVVSVVSDTLQVRSLRMFGDPLPHTDNSGIGPELRFDPADIALRMPTHTVQDRLELEIAGVQLQLVHAPGETDDQLFVYLPERGVLLPGDNIYQAFPNTYTIRGTPHRDVNAWVSSLDAMRDLAPTVLIPSHTRPVLGADAVQDVLTAYRDGIQYVHDQTVRGMNRGRTPDELAHEVRLPPHLAAHPWLQEHYGRVPWSVRGVYHGYMGWFDADAAHLEPLPPDERARRYARAFTEETSLQEQARAALDASDPAWAAELATLWVRAAPDNADAKQLLAESLDALAEGQINRNAVNWYRTAAGELRGDWVITPYDPARTSASMLQALPLSSFMRAMPTRLDPVATADVDEVVAFEFTDVGQTWVLHVRRGVAELRQRDATGIDVRLVTTAQTWKEVASTARNPAGAVASGDIVVEGGLLTVARVLSWFR